MGQLAIAGAVALTSGVLMDYALQLSGTRFAAAYADDQAAINQYLNASLIVKLAIQFADHTRALRGGHVAGSGWRAFLGLVLVAGRRPR